MSQYGKRTEFYINELRNKLQNSQLIRRCAERK